MSSHQIEVPNQQFYPSDRLHINLTGNILLDVFLSNEKPVLNDGFLDSLLPRVPHLDLGVMCVFCSSYSADHLVETQGASDTRWKHLRPDSRRYE